MSLNTDQSAKAFALVIAAGAATAIGSAAVFFPRLVHLANHKTLAASLGLAAGVMLYVSLIDIYAKAISGFQDAGHDENKAFIYTTLSFFGGVVLMKIVHVGVHYLLHLDAPPKQQQGGSNNNNKTTDPSSDSAKEVVLDGDNNKKAEDEGDDATVNHGPTGPTGCCCDSEEDPVQALDDIHRMADVMVAVEEEKAKDDDEEAPSLSEEEAERKKLFSMGAATAIAIAIHNFPEGLVTFIAYIEDPAVGIALAVGIAIHNIPEGLCVSMPIYYATGSRWKGFLWGILCGVSEPIGALIGWVVLKNNFSGNTYGILFGVVAGIMVFIAIDELLPAAYKHDPTGAITSPAVFCGMLLLAVSLMLFSV